MNDLSANKPATRLLKTKMFTERLVVKRKIDGPPGSWEAPVAQSKPIDQAINDWIDQTGNDLVNVSPPNMFMQWMDVERITRLVITAVMVTYIPAVATAVPVLPVTTVQQGGQDVGVLSG